MPDRRTKRDLHALDENGMVLCNPRDREAAHRAEVEGIATPNAAAVTCRKCIELLHRLEPEARSRGLGEAASGSVGTVVDLTYGFSGIEWELAALDALRDNLERVLGLSFVGRYSDYLGGAYFLARGEGREKFTLLFNYDAEVKEAVYSRFSSDLVLLRISRTEREGVIREKLEGFLAPPLLEREEYQVG